MLSETQRAEVARQLTICNACRYCEGICPVFPALERRRTFLERDMVFLANLCHDCRACFEVCPYSPPHELAVNFPQAMADIRVQTYQQYAAPRVLSRAFERGTRTLSLISVGAVASLLVLVTLLRSDRLFASFTGPGSFYEVIPWVAMFVPAMAVTIYGLAIMALGLIRFWRDTDGPFTARLDLSALWEATADVFLLRQMRGGGPGCTYPDERPSHQRVFMHQAVFYGFALTFISTSLAAFYQEILGVLPPYDLLSPVVVSGTVGGILQIVGCVGLISLKLRASSVPASVVMRRLDFAFLASLLVVNASGLVLLALRDSDWMGLLLVLHLGAVAGLFITLPYSKFVHLIYRYAALVRNRQELRKEEQGASVTGSA
jgi:citrate/tricarballylate utilization protein